MIWVFYNDRYYFEYCIFIFRFNLLYCLVIIDELLVNEYVDIFVCILLENEIIWFWVLFGGVKYFYKG